MENSELVNILSAANKDIDNQKLMDYLSNKLTKDEAHDVEKQMADAGIVSDAIEGLQQFKQDNALLLVTQLNADLKRQLSKKKYRRSKRHFTDNVWIYVAVVLIILIIMITYFIARLHLNSA